MLSIDQDLTAQDCIDIGCYLASTNHRKELAEAFFKESLRLEPTNAVAMSDLGSLYATNGNMEAAKEMSYSALISDPRSPLAWHTLGRMANEAGRFDEARAFFTSAVANKPDMPDFWMSLSVNAQFRQQWDEAIEHYQKTLALRPTDPQALMSLGMLYMTKGDMLPGMSLYEKRLVYQNPFPTEMPIWDGVTRDMNGKKVLICCEQGIGDSFMLARYGEYLKEVFPRSYLSLYCSDSIRDIMACWPGFDAIYSPKDVKLPEHDFQIAIFSLPWFCNLAENTWCAPVVSPKIPPRLDIKDGRKRIGVCWRGNPKHVNDKYRSMPLIDISEISSSVLTDHSHFDYYSLQFDATEVERKLMKYELRWDSPSLGSWVETAQTLRELDILVTVDTAVAHLAATLGVRTWLLLPATCDWRWGLESETTRWYDKVRIFRQEKLGQWGPVIERVRLALEAAFQKPVCGDL